MLKPQANARRIQQQVFYDVFSLADFFASGILFSIGPRIIVRSFSVGVIDWDILTTSGQLP
jgi:hypothetical protein